jgi:hypothetical protein
MDDHIGEEMFQTDADSDTGVVDEITFPQEEAKSTLIDWVETKTAKIEGAWQKFISDKQAEGTGLKNVNIVPIVANLLSIDNRVIKLKDRKFTDPEEVEVCFDLFKGIMATLNLKVVYHPSQQSFCMFMGWTDRIYKEMLDSTEEIKELMQMVDSYLYDCQMSAAQLGFATQGITKFRGQVAGEKGMNLVTQKEQNMTDNTARKMKTADDLRQALKDMGSKYITEEESKAKNKKYAKKKT